MNDDPDRQANNEELEALLRRLEPTRLQVDFASELLRDRERVSIAHSRSPARMQWRRVVPLTLVSAFAMVGFAMHRHGGRLFPENASAPEVAASLAPAETAGPVDSRFLPVSVQGYLVKTSADGVVETEAGPLQKLHFEYQDAYHWHDPTTGTNIRFFQPRREEIIAPLQTD